MLSRKSDRNIMIRTDTRFLLEPFCIMLAFMVLLPAVVAQQLTDWALSYEIFDISSSCLAILNSNLTSCDAILGEHATQGDLSFDPLAADELQLLCRKECRQSLSDLGSRVKASCNATNDSIVLQGTKYPDKASGEYCDLIIEDLHNSSQPVPDCSDCVLGTYQLQLGSPIGYSDDYAADFASITASCGASGYGYTKPTPYATPTTSDGEQPPSTPVCSRPYTVQAGDTCDSIAAANRISKYSLLALNNIDFACSQLPPSLCLPPSCSSYKLELSDTCESLAANFNTTTEMLVYWNPILDPSCNNIDRWTFWTICVGPPGGAVPPPPKLTAVPVPPNARDGSNRNCAQWYTVVEGNTCFTILPPGSSISFAEFRVLNPTIDEGCTNLLLGLAYCMRGVDAVAIPVSTTFARPPVSTATTTKQTLMVPTPTINPKAPGTKMDCQNYTNFVDMSVLEPELFSFNGSSGADSLFFNNCWYVIQLWGLNSTEFFQWNPSLKEGDNCTLSNGSSYCMDINTKIVTTVVDDPYAYLPSPTATSSDITSGVPGAPTMTTSATSTTGSAAGPPAPTQSGTISSCKAWHIVISGDGCWAIANQYGISLDDFYAWNPAVGTDCLNLWLDSAVCVGI